MPSLDRNRKTSLSFYTTAEVSAQRFGFLKWLVPLELTCPVVLLLMTDHGYLAGIIPASMDRYPYRPQYPFVGDDARTIKRFVAKALSLQT